MNYIKRKHKNINQVRIFTNKNILYNFLRDRQINVLLVSEDKLIEGVEDENIEEICVLSEGNYLLEDNEEKKNIIYKFQSGEQILMKLYEFYPELNNNTNNKNSNKSKIISVFSFDESFAKDNFSFNLANQYGIIKKTLLIDFNLFHGMYQLQDLKSEKNLSEFLYFLKSRVPNILLKMTMETQRLGSFDYLKGVTFGPDLYDLTSSDIEFWLKELDTSDYEVIIFNIGFYMQTMLDLFRKSDDLYFITNESPWSQSLYNNLEEQLTWVGYEDIINELKVIEVGRGLIEKNKELQTNNIFNEEWGDLARLYAGDN